MMDRLKARARFTLDTGVVVTLLRPLDPDRFGLWEAEAVIEGQMQPVVVKAGVVGVKRDNRIEVESRIYEFIEESGIAADSAAGVLRYYGKYSRDGHQVIAIERGLRDFTTLIGRWGEVDEVRDDLTLMLAHSLLTTLLGLDEAASLVGPQASVKYQAHRDLTPANVFMTERDGRLVVALGDFGYGFDVLHSGEGLLAKGVAAPEQRGTAHPRPSSLDTDLWAVGLLLWQLHHHGFTPYRDDAGRWLPSNDTDIVRNNGLRPAWDVEYGPGDLHRRPANPAATALSVARALLIPSEGTARVIAAKRMLDQIEPEHAALTARLASPEAAEAFAVKVADALTDEDQPARPTRNETLGSAGRTIVGLAPARAPRPARPKADRAREPFRAPRLPGWLRALGSFALRSIFTTLQVVGTAGIAATAALVLGWWQTMPLPSAIVDERNRYVIATVFTVIALVVGGWAAYSRWIGTPQNRRRPLRPTQALVSGFIAASLVPLFVAGVLGEPIDASAIVLSVATGLLGCAVYGRVPFRPTPWLTADEATTDGGAAYRAPLRPVVSSIVGAVGVAAIVATLVAPLPSPLTNHEVRASLNSLVPGMPSGEPVFMDPHAMAVSDSGTVAVVDRVSPGRDVVWLVHPNQAPVRALSTYNWRPANGVAASIPDGAPLNPLQWFGSTAVSAPTGDAVRSVVSLDFLDDDTLILLGEDGVTRLDYLEGMYPDGVVRATDFATSRISDAVTTTGLEFSKRSRVIVDGDDIYLYRVAVPQDVEPRDYCDYDSTGAPNLWALYDLASEPQAVTRDSQYRDEPCIDVVRGIYEDADGPKAITTRWDGTAHYTATSTLDGAEWSPLPDIPVDLWLQNFGVAGDRMILVTSYCLGGLEGDESVGLPTFTPQSLSYANPEDECQSLPDAWKHYQGDVESGTFPAERECSDRSAVANLWTARYLWSPVAFGGQDNSAYVVSPPARGCTPIIYRLENESASAEPVGDVKSQSVYASDYELGVTAIMSATEPTVTNSNSLIRWYAPSLGRLRTGVGGTNYDLIRAFAYTEDRPVIILAHTDGLYVEIGTPPNTEDESTELAATIVPDEGDPYTARLAISGLTDMKLDAGNDIVLARCGQILRVSIEWLRSLPAPGTESLSVDIEGLRAAFAAGELVDDVTVIVGAGSPFEPCAELSDATTARVQGLSTPDIAPNAIDFVSAEVGSEKIYFAETALFGTQAVSRIRVADLAEGTVRTVGYNAEDPVHVRANNANDASLFAGDLSALALAPTDVAVNDRGQIAISTATATGTGPLLLLEDNVVRVIRTSSDTEPSGVAWKNDRLVVTDGREGDLEVLELPATPVEGQQPWRSWLAGLLGSEPTP